MPGKPQAFLLAMHSKGTRPGKLEGLPFQGVPENPVGLDGGPGSEAFFLKDYEVPIFLLASCRCQEHPSPAFTPKFLVGVGSRLYPIEISIRTESSVPFSITHKYPAFPFRYLIEHFPRAIGMTEPQSSLPLGVIQAEEGSAFQGHPG